MTFFLDAIHTVGPVGENKILLENCYQSCLDLVLQHDVKSVVNIILLTIYSTNKFLKMFLKIAAISFQILLRKVSYSPNTNDMLLIIILFRHSVQFQQVFMVSPLSFHILAHIGKIPSIV